MIRVVSWNIGKRRKPWQELAEMGRRGEADVALLQETDAPPESLSDAFQFENNVFWDRGLYDR